MSEPLDKGIIVGDVVTGLYPGFYEVVSISRSWGVDGIARVFQGESQEGLEQVAVYFRCRCLLDDNYNFVNSSVTKVFNHKDVDLVTKKDIEQLKIQLFEKISSSFGQLSKLARN